MVGSFHIPEEEQPRVGRIPFRLMNHEYYWTLDEWFHHFGFDNSTTANCFNCFTMNPSPLNYFSRMKVPYTLPQGNNIKYPSISYLYYVIAYTLQVCGDFTRVNEEDMMVLAKAAIQDCNLTLNLGAILLFYLEF
jgi:hypothetical protein